MSDPPDLEVRLLAIEAVVQALSERVLDPKVFGDLDRRLDRAAAGTSEEDLVALRRQVAQLTARHRA